MRPYELLKNFGIEYLEIRGIDLSPHDITGISKHHMRFLDLVLIYCLIKNSPKISSEEKDLIDKNDQATIYGGRNENTEVFIDGKEININAAKEKGNIIIPEIEIAIKSPASKVFFVTNKIPIIPTSNPPNPVAPIAGIFGLDLNRTKFKPKAAAVKRPQNRPKK